MATPATDITAYTTSLIEAQGWHCRASELDLSLNFSIIHKLNDGGERQVSSFMVPLSLLDEEDQDFVVRTLRAKVMEACSAAVREPISRVR